MFGGEVEVDESYFGGRRKGRRGRGAGGKTPVFGILKRGRKAYTKIIPNASSATLCPTASSIPTVRRATTCSTCQPLSTSGSIIGSYSPTSKTISTGSRTSGTRRSVTYASSTVFRRLNSGYIWRNVSENLTTVTRWINYPKLNDGITDTFDSPLVQPQLFLVVNEPYFRFMGDHCYIPPLKNALPLK